MNGVQCTVGHDPAAGAVVQASAVVRRTALQTAADGERGRWTVWLIVTPGQRPRQHIIAAR